MLCTQQIVNVLCQIKQKISYRQHASAIKHKHASFDETDQTQSSPNWKQHCDILGSFYKEKVRAADCCLGRGKLIGSLLRKQGQLAKAQLRQHCESTSGCWASLLLPLLRSKVSSNAAAPAFTPRAAQTLSDRQVLYHFAISPSLCS